MTTRHDDRQARLTAYALDEELTSEERREIEALLEHDDDARLEVESLREVAALLRDELTAEDSVDDSAFVDDAMQQRIEARAVAVAAGELQGDATSDAPQPQPQPQPQATPAKRARWSRKRRALVFSTVGLAATVLLAVGVLLPMAAKRDSGYADFRVASSAEKAPQFLRRRPAHGSGQAPGLEARHAAVSKEVKKSGESTIASNDPSDGDRGIAEKDKRDKRKRGLDAERREKATFKLAARQPLSTFSVDVDTAAYANVRRFLSRSMMPPRSAVRVEEMLNYFSYDYPQPSAAHPVGLHLEVAGTPWNPKHRLVRVALAAKSMRADKRPPSNLVFLLDVSGSMSSDNKLPLLRRALSMLVRKLGEKDRVAIVVYAGASGLVLPSTSCASSSRSRVLAALEKLSAGGSTNGGAGIELAYRVAVANFIPGGVNRVVLATDGDFNVGISSRTALVRMIKSKAKSGVYLSVLGFGMSRHSDGTLEQIADKGNGHYAYIDTLAEARKVLVDEINSTLVTVAKDVKIQVEFNPARVAAYRLIGYQNRRLAARDFANDKKDAGEVGAGHRVTALYEVVPVGVHFKAPGIPKLKYATRVVPKNASAELLTVKVRYKRPQHEQSTLLSQPLVDRGGKFAVASREFRFAAAVAWFGEALRGSPYVERAPYRRILAAARAARGPDRFGYRLGLIRLVRRARDLTRAKRPRLYDAYK